jgi:hypothetical protein
MWRSLNLAVTSLHKNFHRLEEKEMISRPALKIKKVI